MPTRRAAAPLIFTLVCLCASVRGSYALGQPRYVLATPVPGAFRIVQSKAAAPLYVDSNGYPGVIRAVHDLQADIARVTGATPAIAVEAILSPTLNFVPGRGLRYAISFDDQPPQTVDALAQNSQRDWETSVKDAVRKSKSTHTLEAPGYHTLKFWMVDPAVVLQKLVVNLGGVKPSYLGPPESYRAISTLRP